MGIDGGEEGAKPTTPETQGSEGSPETNLILQIRQEQIKLASLESAALEGLQTVTTESAQFVGAWKDQLPVTNHTRSEPMISYPPGYENYKMRSGNYEEVRTGTFIGT